MKLLLLLLAALSPLYSTTAFPSQNQYQSPDCYDCHGQAPTDAVNPGADFRPIDAQFRNVTTGGFQGNHRTHMAQTLDQNVCVKCHGAQVSSYTTGHTNGLIYMNANINNSPKTGGATYSRGVQFNWSSNQNQVGICSNVNCHFEALSPIWGSPNLTAQGACNTCHGFPPAGSPPDYTSGAAGSHLLHTTDCSKCHPDHTVETAPFAHATSVVSRGIELQSFIFYSSDHGSPLPSQSASREPSTCLTTCHSDGVTGTAQKTPAWGYGHLRCDGCHGYPPSYVSGAPKPNGHPDHPFSCDTCHYGTTTDGATISSTVFHANGHADVIPGRGISFSYAGGTCLNVSCHAGNNMTWGATVTFTCGSCHLTSPGGD